MSGLDVQRDDGPLARLLPTGLVPVPQVLLVLAAVFVGVGVPALGERTGMPVTAWVWTLAGVALALVAGLGRARPRLGWPVPGLLRALEYGAFVVLLGGSLRGYALLGTVAFHHYDIVYRARIRGAGPARWLTRATGGWELRTVAVAVAVSLGVAETVVSVVTPALAVVFVAEAVGSWTRPAHAASAPDPA